MADKTVKHVGGTVNGNPVRQPAQPTKNAQALTASKGWRERKN